MKKTTIHIADYMKDFQCLGSDCEDTCCQGWYVNIDKKTFVKYKRIADKKTRNRIQKHLRRNKYETTFSDYATIRMGENGLCPFLNTQKLCSIQLEMGESYLSRTCATYPRQYTEVFERFELTGAVSCPEIARLVLMRKEGIRIEEVPNRDSSEIVLDRALDDDIYTEVFLPVRQFVRSVWSNRTLPIMCRLLVIGGFTEDLSQLISAGNLDKTDELIDTYRQKIHSGAWRDRCDGLPVDPESHWVFLRERVASYISRGTVQTRYRNLYEECQAGWESLENYEQAYHAYFLPFLNEHGYMLENYLDNYCLSMLFPFSNVYQKQPPFDDWLILGLHVALLQFHLIGFAHSRQGLTAEDALKVFQVFARTYEHDVTYFSNFLKQLHEDGLATVDFLSVMVTIHPFFPSGGNT